MSFNTQESKEAVLTLRDRLKHGQNMTKILESQLETAQQNISLLQGQVRLANETIFNLKKYFQETESTVNELLTPTTTSTNHKTSSSRAFQYNNETSNKKDEINSERIKHPTSSRNKLSRSPIQAEPIESKALEDKRDHHNKSPYAQQLRQVLDVLQDEEPKKAMYRQLHEREFDDQQQQHSRPSSTSSSHKPSYHINNNIENEPTYHHHHHRGNRNAPPPEEDYGKPPTAKQHHRMNGYSSHESPPEISSKPSSSFYRGSGNSQQPDINHHHQHQQQHHQSYSPSHCLGPCCQSEPSPSNHRHNNNNNYKMVGGASEKNHHFERSSVENMEKAHYADHNKSPAPSSSNGVRYIAMHSPDEIQQKHHSDSNGRHHSNGGQHYISYAYHLPVGATESPTHKVIHEMVQPMSPTGRRKRAYVPLLPNEEPPHLKYTKVKRIDGSKLTAQKVLQGTLYQHLFENIKHEIRLSSILLIKSPSM